MTVDAPPRPALVEQLTGRLETALELHLSRAQEWFPHEYVPWGQARDFAELPWDVAQSALPAEVRAAVQLNLLTEDNLPGYHGALSLLLGTDEAWRTWLDRWTAEEGRHSIALRDYLTVTRACDPATLESDRMATVSGGFSAGARDGLHVIAYVALQELATRVSHRSTGKLSGDEGLDRLLGRIAADENLHMVLYRDLIVAALELDPAQALRAVTDEIAGFAMPGVGIPGFLRRAAVVARAGIYDLQVHRDQVVQPMLRHWGVFELTGPGVEPEQERLTTVLAELDRQAERYLNRQRR